MIVDSEGSLLFFHLLKDKSKKDEALYHPRLTYIEPEEDEESEAESYEHSDGSYSPRRSRMSSGGSSGEESSPRRRPGPKKLNSVSPSSPRKPERRSERMFDDSDDDSSTEKEGTNLNWTPAEVVTPTPPVSTGRRRGGPPGTKDPASSTGSGLINLCATVPPVPGGGGAMPAEARSAAAAITHTTQQGEALTHKHTLHLHCVANRDLLALCHNVIFILTYVRLCDEYLLKCSVMIVSKKKKMKVGKCCPLEKIQSDIIICWLHLSLIL